MRQKQVSFLFVLLWLLGHATVLAFTARPSSSGWNIKTQHQQHHEIHYGQKQHQRHGTVDLHAFGVTPRRSLVHFSTPSNNENTNNNNDNNNSNCSDQNVACRDSTTTTTTSTADSFSSFTPSPLMLDPFLAAADPQYIVQGPVGEGDFVLKRHGGPRPEELTNENLLLIVQSKCSDLEVNTLVWKCLGYRFVVVVKPPSPPSPSPEEKENKNNNADDDIDSTTTSNNNDSYYYYWSNEEVFPKWRERYPQPPDLIGMQRIYSKEVDQPSLRSNQALIRSIPSEKKQSLKTHLKPLGFNGYQYNELTPNKTRRAQCTNWLLYYREELFGRSVEELQERRRLQEEAAATIKRQQEQQQQQQANEGEEWKPPIQQVF